MSEHVPTTDEIRYRVEHDWAPYGDGSFDAWLDAHDAQVRAEAWDEGAATAWDEAVRAMEWAQQNGPEQHWLAYVRNNNPYRIAEGGTG